MRVKDKIWYTKEQLIEEGPITIVAFGDSITHGAFELGCLDYDAVYWNVLRKKMMAVRDYIPINIIDAGIGGITAKDSLNRLESQVLSHNPDLVIVCFALNDINDTLENYLSALRTIFERCSVTDVIFMTPNMLNTYVAEDTAPVHREYAEVTAKYQNSGKMDLYVNSAVELAREMNVTVCDCYSQWKEWSKTQDTTQLLCNRINHPNREMHKIFAENLFRVIFADAEVQHCAEESTMFVLKDN